MMDNFDSVPLHPSVQASLFSCEDFSKKFICKGNSILGQGGTSVVVKARSADGSADVAVKSYLKGGEFRPAFQKRLCFETEVSILAKIKHKNIMEMIMACEFPTFYAITLSCYRGGDLIDLLPEIKKEQTNKIFVQTASAVHYLHNNGVVHRDIKPDNILLTSEGDAVLSDFGLSRVVGSKAMFLSIRLGTRAYMAPEISEKPIGSPIDWYKCDMYSLGLMLWCMVVGHTPTSNPDREDILSAVPQDGEPQFGSYYHVIQSLTLSSPDLRWGCQFLVEVLRFTLASGDEFDGCSTAASRETDLVDLKYEERYREFLVTHKNYNNDGYQGDSESSSRTLTNQLPSQEREGVSENIPSFTG